MRPLPFRHYPRLTTTYAPVIRAVKGVLSVIDDKIKAYQDTIASLIIAFDQHTTINIEKQVFRVLQGVESIGMSPSADEVLEG